MNLPRRAISPEQKRAIIEQLLAAWLRMPEQRFGQLLCNSIVGRIEASKLFNREDLDLADDVTALADRVVKP